MISVYVFGVIIAVLFVAGLVLAPLLEGEPADPDDADSDASPGERREAALDALEDLEFEHETGKLSDDDYRRLRNRYARAAVEARDAAEGGGAERTPAGDGEAAGDPAATDGSGGEQEAAFCPECGSAAAEGARFCARCGARLPA